MSSIDMCCLISSKATAPGSSRCAKRLPITPHCSPPTAIPRSKTRCIWRCRPRDFSTTTTTAEIKARLGNQFLATIREVDAIAHVVRCFEDSDITHVEGKIAPLADIETIETELMLADLESLEKRVDNLTKKAKGNDKDAREQLDLVNRALALLREGQPARLLERKPEEERAFGMLGLLTPKPVLYVCNVEEGSAAQGNGFSKQVFERAKEEN